jgi:hypothetical protein
MLGREPFRTNALAIPVLIGDSLPLQRTRLLSLPVAR